VGVTAVAEERTRKQHKGGPCDSSCGILLQKGNAKAPQKMKKRNLGTSLESEERLKNKKLASEK